MKPFCHCQHCLPTEFQSLSYLTSSQMWRSILKGNPKLREDDCDFATSGSQEISTTRAEIICNGDRTFLEAICPLFSPVSRNLGPPQALSAPSICSISLILSPFTHTRIFANSLVFFKPTKKTRTAYTHHLLRRRWENKHVTDINHNA